MWLFKSAIVIFFLFRLLWLLFFESFPFPLLSFPALPLLRLPSLLFPLPPSLTSSLVIQLIKSRSKEQKLGILFEGQNRRDYTFASMQVSGSSFKGGTSSAYFTRGVVLCCHGFVLSWFCVVVVSSTGSGTLLPADSDDPEQTPDSPRPRLHHHFCRNLEHGCVCVGVGVLRPFFSASSLSVPS